LSMDPLAAKKRWKMAIWSVVAGMLAAVLVIVVVPAYHVAHGAGLLEHHDERTYNATNEGNLKALYTALMLYHDSEGQFPQAAGWMDAIKTRIQANDMKPEEAAKKLVNPLAATGAGTYGYAMNDAASATGIRFRR